MEGLLTTPEGFKRLKEIVSSGGLEEEEVTTVTQREIIVVVDESPDEREVSVNPDDECFRILRKAQVPPCEKKMCKRIFGQK